MRGATFMKLNSVYEQIIETRTGKPSDEERKIIGELCMKYDTDIRAPRSRKYINIINDILKQINECPDDKKTKTLESAKKRVSKCLKEYRNKSYYHYMDYIEPGVNMFINKYYGVRPDDDVFVCIYLLFLRDKYQIERELRHSDKTEIDIAFSYMRRLINGEENGQLIMRLSELNKSDLAIYEDFKSKYSLTFADMPFFKKELILNDYFLKNNGY